MPSFSAAPLPLQTGSQLILLFASGSAHWSFLSDVQLQNMEAVHPSVHCTTATTNSHGLCEMQYIQWLQDTKNQVIEEAFASDFVVYLEDADAMIISTSCEACLVLNRVLAVWLPSMPADPSHSSTMTAVC